MQFSSDLACLRLWALVMSIAIFTYFYKAWVKPMIAAKLAAVKPREYGPDRRLFSKRDNQVSWREEYIRSSWRYDETLDRVMSLVGVLIMVFIDYIAIVGH